MKKKFATKNNYFKIILLIVLGVIILLIINYFTNPNTKNTVDDLLGLDPNATTEQSQAADDIPKNIAIPGFEKLTFEANRLSQEVAFENPEQNDVYFIISLSIDDYLVYESKLIEPGKGIYSIELPNTYDAGEYTGKVTYESRSIDDSNEKKNGAVINIPIFFK